MKEKDLFFIIINNQEDGIMTISFAYCVMHSSKKKEWKLRKIRNFSVKTRMMCPWIGWLNTWIISIFIHSFIFFSVVFLKKMIGWYVKSPQNILYSDKKTFRNEINQIVEEDTKKNRSSPNKIMLGFFFFFSLSISFSFKISVIWRISNHQQSIFFEPFFKWNKISKMEKFIRELTRSIINSLKPLQIVPAKKNIRIQSEEKDEKKNAQIKYSI